jgi:hypothetical protein
MAKIKSAARQTVAQFNDNENPVLRLFMKKDGKGRAYIDAEQLAAADRLRRDFEQSLMQPRTTMAYQEPTSKGGQYWQTSDNAIANLSDGAIAARERFAKAMTMLGPELSSIAYNVCCLAGGIENAERHLALPQRSGKAVLSIALNLLARHYGMKRQPSGQFSSRR